MFTIGFVMLSIFIVFKHCLTILEKNLVTRKARVQLKVVEIDDAIDFT